MVMTILMQIGYTTKLQPSVQTTIQCPTVGYSDVTIFEFAPQLLYLLQNSSSIMNIQKLITDPINPLQCYNQPDGHLGKPALALAMPMTN